MDDFLDTDNIYDEPLPVEDRFMRDLFAEINQNHMASSIFYLDGGRKEESGHFYLTLKHLDLLGPTGQEMRRHLHEVKNFAREVGSKLNMQLSRGEAETYLFVDLTLTQNCVAKEVLKYLMTGCRPDLKALVPQMVTEELAINTEA